MKLSYREKIILMVSVIVITLFVGFTIVIKPQIESIIKNKALLSQKQSEMAEINERLNSSAGLSQKLQDEYDSQKSLFDFFLPEMNTYEVDQYISDILTANNLKINSMNLTPMTATDMSVYTYKTNDTENPLQNISDLIKEITGEAEDSSVQAETKDSSDQTTEQPSEQAMMSTATIEFSSSKNDFKAFLDAVDKLDKAVIVTGCEVSDFDTDIISGTVTVNFYSIS